MRVRIPLVIVGTLIAAGVKGQNAIPSNQEPRKANSLQSSLPGPWGELDYYEIPLVAPEETLQMIDVPSEQTGWAFQLETEEEIVAALQKEGIPGEEVDELVDDAVLIVDAEGSRLFPSNDALISLRPSTRQKLYRFLGRYGQNRFHRRPVYLNSANVSTWFQGTDLPRSVLQAIAELAYPTPSGTGFFLADVPYLMQQANSSPEERFILHALMRRPALMVRLKLDADSDLEALTSYWSAGFKNKAVRPLMESIVRTSDVGRIDIAHLLPPTPRRTLYTFPETSEGISGRYPDWFWSCYNFFRFTPVDVYADSPERDGLIATEFEPALPPYQYGDMIVLNSGTRRVHGCIYVADDIVYTKNGADVFSPWVLMKLKDVVAYHDLAGDITAAVYRKR